MSVRSEFPFTLTLVCPVPPAKSGIADYCFEQLEAYVAKARAVQVVTEHHSPAAQAPAGVKVLNFKEWVLKKPDPDEIIVYHIGNNPDHKFVYECLQKKPGYLVLHDYVLHHMLTKLSFMEKGPGDYKALLFREYGDLSRFVTDRRLANAFSQYEYFLMPLNQAAVDKALGVICHSRYTAGLVSQAAPGKNVAVIPHHVDLQKAEQFGKKSRLDLRGQLELPPNALIFGALGYATPPKQILLSLQAVAELLKRGHDVHYCIIGENYMQKEIDELVSRERVLDGRIQVAGFVDLDRFYDYLQAIDVVINLRYPSAGESSGTLSRALSMGRCCVVFDYATFTDFPDDVVVKVPLETFSVEPLLQTLEQLVRSPEKIEKFGARAKAFACSNLEVGLCVSEYLRQLGTWHARPSTPNVNQPDPEFLPGSAAHDVIDRVLSEAEADGSMNQYLRTHYLRFVETLKRIPKGSPGAQAVELGSYGTFLPVLREELGYERVCGSDFYPDSPEIRETSRSVSYRGQVQDYSIFNFNLEKDAFPLNSAAFDLVLCCEVVEHLTSDPMFMMAEINRVLKKGGYLMMTTPNIASAASIEAALNGTTPISFPVFLRNGSTNRHNIEYSPDQIQRLCEAAGLEIVKMDTADCWRKASGKTMKMLKRYGYSTDLRGDNLFVIARKVTNIVNRFPDPIYLPTAPVVFQNSQDAARP